MTRGRKWAIAIAALIVIGGGIGLVAYEKLLRRDFPVYASDVEHFKYGSIGNDDVNGLPYLLWRVLPDVFPEYLPGPSGYASLGFAWEEGHDRSGAPIGFSRARIGFERMAINCAFCHNTSLRFGENAAPTMYPAGPASMVDVLGYQTFLTKSARDSRFTPDVLLPAIDRVAPLSFLDRMIYRFAIIPLTQKALLKQGEAFGWADSRTVWGPGRIDPFNPVKFGMLGLPDDGTQGNSVMQPVWGLDARNAIRPNAPLHWDGLNTSIHEVVVSSTLGDGAVAKNFDWPSINRIEHFLRTTAPPPSPLKTDAALAAQGQAVFAANCAECHGKTGARTLTVIPLAEIGTDRNRVDMWTTKARDAYNSYRKDYDWGFKSFQKVEGYVPEPLDAVWLRGPYLHNGSTPTLSDMLLDPGERPKTFVVGYNVFDQARVGFVSSGPAAEKSGRTFDTALRGNSNAGHVYGTKLPEAEKRALLEYLKTL
jgi:hypothetical protein